MKRNIRIHAALVLAVCLVGCSEGPSATTDQMTASRDAQMKAMQDQRKAATNPTARGAGSIDAAAKASHGPAGSTGQ